MNNKTTRRRTRLKDYDYSSNGAYFITICTQERKQFFGRLKKNNIYSEPEIVLSEFGKVLDNQIEEINNTYQSIKIKQYSIMPDHIHFIVNVCHDDGSSGMPTPTNSEVPKLVGALKRLTNRKCGCNLWQRGYHDHIIRDEEDYLKYWKYINENHFLKGKI